MYLFMHMHLLNVTVKCVSGSRTNEIAPRQIPENDPAEAATCNTKTPILME